MVIPARADEPFLSEAIESALSEPEVAELVVATHEANSPTTRLVLGHIDPRINLVYSRGPSAAENLDAGIPRTTSPWLAFLDADDRWPPGRIATALRAAVAAPGTELVIGCQQAMGENGSLIDVTAPAPLLGAALITRAAADRIGAFGTDMVAQMRWLLRASELGVPTVELPDVVLHRRAHAGNLTRVQRPELHRAYLRLAREQVARRRHRAERRDG